MKIIKPNSESDSIYNERLISTLRYLAVCLGSGALVLLIIATVTFFAMQQMPGDPAISILGGLNPTAEAIAEVKREYGLDQPLYVQYWIYLSHLLQGDLGISYSQRLPVVHVIAQQAGATFELIVAALVMTWALVLAWTLTTAGRRRWISHLGSTVETILAALPPFWLAILLLAVFAFNLRLFPVAGSDSLHSLILPALALALPLAGFVGQVTRQSLEITLEQPFILSARLRGLSDWSVRWRHALRHSLLPGISLSGWAIGALASGSVVIEVIFSRQGLGRQLFQAVQSQDMPLVVGITLVVALTYVLVNILVDLLYHLVDPRLKGETA
ncbi:ABC transporter permease [Acinetobacter bouvetii]|uniref:Glutathione transport system permease protein GsiC n=1 Tax=Acinetobacter bouvetii TaxID=202951 RepID=A0A811GAJ4_9GAMM|nr:ABC transporter permease [Acinetobacter bouvetii]CAB1214265.1 Glutathione transport system permease protein GsiC [Acinetobacter bouvetii]